MARRKETLSKGLLLLASLAAGLLLAEAAARRVPAFKLESFERDFRPGLNEHPAYRADARLGYVHVPNALTKMMSRTNALGLVNPDYPLSKKPGVKRLLVLGDSITEDGRYTAELQRLLGDGWEVWNAGVGGYNAVQYARIMEKEALEYRPDFVLLGLCLNDLTYDVPVFWRDETGRARVFSYESSPDEHLAYDVKPWARRLLSPTLLVHSALYRAAVTALHSSLGSRSEVAERKRMTGLAQLGRVKELAAARGWPLAAALFPYLELESALPAEWKLERRVMPGVLDALAIPWLDLGPTFPGDPRSWRVHPSDRIHPSAEGHRRAARAIFEFLTRRGWTKASARPGT